MFINCLLFVTHCVRKRTEKFIQQKRGIQEYTQKLSTWWLSETMKGLRFYFTFDLVISPVSVSRILVEGLSLLGKGKIIILHSIAGNLSILFTAVLPTQSHPHLIELMQIWSQLDAIHTGGLLYTWGTLRLWSPGHFYLFIFIQIINTLKKQHYWKYNLCTKQLINLKWTVSFLYCYSFMESPSQSVLEHFYHPLHKPYTLQQVLPINQLSSHNPRQLPIYILSL